MVTRSRSASRDLVSLKMYNAKPGCMGDGVGTPDRVKLVDQYSDMEFCSMDRYAKVGGNRLV